MDRCNVEIVQPEIDVSQQAVVLIDDTIDASVETADPIIQVDAEEYVLSSGGMYGGNGLIGAVPDWILKAVEQQLTTGDGNLMSVLQDLQALMTSFQIGVHQQITSLNTDMYSQNGIITTISSQVEQNRADALSLIDTKATPEYALAVATDAIQARFADEFGGVSAEAFIGSVASTYVDANSAIAQEVDLLSAALNGVSATITSMDSVIVEQGDTLNTLNGEKIYYSISAVYPTAVAPAILKAGDLWVVEDRWYSDASTAASRTTATNYGYLVRRYDGTTWHDITNADAKASSIKWSASSSKYITAPDGSITGFEMSDGTGQNSSFTIKADQFKIVASGQSVASRNPFTVNATTGEIMLNGKVSFTNVTGTENVALLAGNGVNIANAYYSDFNYDIFDSTQFAKSATATIGSASVGYYGSKSLELTASGSDAFVFLSSGNTAYNIPITPGKKWILSAYVYLSSMNSPKTVNNLQIYMIKGPSGTYTTAVTRSIPLNTWTLVTAAYDFTADLSTNSVLIRFDNESFNSRGNTTMYIDAVMLEEQIGALTTPSTYSPPITSGSSLAGLINTNTTTIDGGRITTNTITANHLTSNSVTTGKIALGTGIVNGYVHSSGFPYPSGNIIGNPSGFRLSSNAAGTYDDPTVYGAYIRGGVISAESIVSGSITTGNRTSFSLSKRYGQDGTYTLGSFTSSNTSGQMDLLISDVTAASTGNGAWSGILSLLKDGVVIRTYGGFAGNAYINNIYSDGASSSTYTLQVTLNFGYVESSCTITGDFSLLSIRK